MSRFIYSVLIGIVTLNCFIKCEMSVEIPFTAPSTELIAELIQKFFIPQTSIISISLSAHSHAQKLQQLDIINDVLHKIQNSFAFYLESGYGASQIPVTNKRRFNIIFVEDYESIETFLTSETVKLFDVTGYYLIIITRYDEEESLDLMAKIFQFAWSSYIININVLLAKSDIGKEVFIYTYLPYKPRKCNDTTPMKVPVSKIRNDNFFPSKTRNLHNCKLLISTNYKYRPSIYGSEKLHKLEINLLHTLANRLNFEIVSLMISDWLGNLGEIFPNGTTTGLLNFITNRGLQFTIGAWSLRENRLNLMDATLDYFQTDLILIIPPGEPYSSFQNLLLPFESVVWIIIWLQFGFSILFVFCLKFVAASKRHFIIGRNNVSPLLSVASISLGGPIYYPPVRNFARTLVMIWVLDCFVIRSLYQGSLFSWLQVSRNFSAADTIDKMIERDFKFYTISTNHYYLESIPNVRDRIVPVNLSVWDYYWDRVRNSDFKGALLSNRLNAANDHLIGKEQIRLISFVIYLPKGSYLTEQFNLELSGYWASGLIGHWSNSSANQYLKPGPATQEPSKMILKHFSGTFNLFMLLLLFSFVIFALELLSKWVRWIKLILDFLTY